MRILLVERDDEMRRGVAGTLREDGFEVLDLGDGRELLQRVRAVLGADDGKTPTAVVAGSCSTAPACLDVLSAVRDADRDVPVILATAPADRASGAEAYRLGADAVVDEPLDPDQVLAALELVLAQRSD